MAARFREMKIERAERDGFTYVSPRDMVPSKEGLLSSYLPNVVSSSVLSQMPEMPAIAQITDVIPFPELPQMPQMVQQAAAAASSSGSGTGLGDNLKSASDGFYLHQRMAETAGGLLQQAVEYATGIPMDESAYGMNHFDRQLIAPNRHVREMNERSKQLHMLNLEDPNKFRDAQWCEDDLVNPAY